MRAKPRLVRTAVVNLSLLGPSRQNPFLARGFGSCCNIAITLSDPPRQFSKRLIAFHEKAGPRQVDFDLPFLKSPFPSWRRVFQSGPERSRARSLRRQRTLDGEDRSVTIPPGRKGSGCSGFWCFHCSCFAPKATLSPPFHPHSSVSDLFARCKLGVPRFSRCCHLLVDLSSTACMEVGPGD